MHTFDDKINCFIACSSEDIIVARRISMYLQNEGINTKTWDSFYFAGMTMLENLQNTVSKADFTILLITSNNIIKNNYQSNLFFEMGVIVGMGKPLLVLAEKDTEVKLPSDLSSMLYLTYDSNNIEYSLRYIRNWAFHSLNI